MRVFWATLGATAALGAAIAGAAEAQSSPGAQRALRRTLTGDMRQVGGASGAYVADLSTGSQPLFSVASRVGRMPASVEKLYTTSTALLRFGPRATLPTTVLGRGFRGPSGTWYGTLYLRGGGDPTFGDASFDQYAYGTGATIQRLVARLIRRAGITAIRGAVVGDQHYFDSLIGTSESGFQFDPYMEGSLSALAYDRGLTN